MAQDMNSPRTAGDTIIRRAKVDRSRTPQQVLDATGRRQHVLSGVVSTMPRGEGDEVFVHFFRVGNYVFDERLWAEFERRDLRPDPYAQAQVNADDPTFADEHPNGSHWQDEEGRWCFIAFINKDNDQDVTVSRDDDAFDGDWWFAGVPK